MVYREKVGHSAGKIDTVLFIKSSHTQTFTVLSLCVRQRNFSHLARSESHGVTVANQPRGGHKHILRELQGLDINDGCETKVGDE